MNQAGTPQAVSAPTIAPAEVPTTYSASPGNQPLARASASSAPVIQAPPMTPPPPSTRPTLGELTSPKPYPCRVLQPPYVGRRLARREDGPLVRGRGRFAADVRPDGL